MDNSSRNIVIFIGTITFSAMLLMAANFYAGWREAETIAVTETTKAESPAIVEEASIDETALAKAEEEEELPEDEDFPLLGEPMVNIEGDEATSSVSPPPPSGQPADPAPTDTVIENYEANN
jgi:hypothetical protein